MIQSVHRALSLLELIDSADIEEGISLSELAELAGLNASTARNLLATLISMGYADQNPAKRYILGRAARTLGCGRDAFDTLVRKIQPVVEKLGETENETMILAVWDKGKRNSLFSVESNSLLRVGVQVGVDENFYNTATGHVLLAQRSDVQLEKFVAKHGLPGEEWPEVVDFDSLRSCLESIRRKGYAEYIQPRSHVVALALPVPSAQANAALGLFYPAVRDNPGRRQHLLTVLCAAVRSVSENTSHRSQKKT